MKFISICKKWKRDVWSPLVPNLGPWFDMEGSQLLAQSSHLALSDLLQEMDGRVDHFGAVPQPLWPQSTITNQLACSQVSSDYFGISFVHYGGEMKHKTPWEECHSNNIF